MRIFVLVSVGMASLGSGAALAEKFSATCECGKADQEHYLPAGDRPDHNLGVAASKCSWSKPLELIGDTTKDSVATNLIDSSGSKFHIQGVHELTMQSGDKVALVYQGNGLSKDKQEDRSKRTFTFANGTGKLKGITGKGTFDCKSAGEGVSCAVEGEYQLAK